MISITARQHADKFFRNGHGNQLLALRKGMSHKTWLATCDKQIEKRLSHLRGSDFDDAYESILTRLLQKAEGNRLEQSHPQEPIQNPNGVSSQHERSRSPAESGHE
jgi:hypothetical protein